MKSANCLPEEVHLLNDVATLESRLAAETLPAARERLATELRDARLRLTWRSSAIAPNHAPAAGGNNKSAGVGKSARPAEGGLAAPPWNFRLQAEDRAPSERLQELDEVALLRGLQVQPEQSIVVIDHREEIPGASVMEIGRMLPERAQRVVR